MWAVGGYRILGALEWECPFGGILGRHIRQWAVGQLRRMPRLGRRPQGAPAAVVVGAVWQLLVGGSTYPDRWPSGTSPARRSQVGERRRRWRARGGRGFRRCHFSRQRLHWVAGRGQRMSRPGEEAVLQLVQGAEKSAGGHRAWEEELPLGQPAVSRGSREGLGGEPSAPPGGAGCYARLCQYRSLGVEVEWAAVADRRPCRLVVARAVV